MLLSLHLKATMMKISDPIMFGHAVSVFFADALEQACRASSRNWASIVNNGLGDLYAKIAKLPEAARAEIEADIKACYATRPELAMVNSDKGITNLHVPSDVIVDASMPAMIRESGKMWGPDGKLHDTKAMIPDRCYAGVYQVVIEDCKKHGAFDPKTMGSVPNVGLMAQKAEEYGSHDKTFEIAANGTVRVVDASGAVLLEQKVEHGDIFRMCQVKDAPIQDWVKLAVTRARLSNTPAVFWLDQARGHDAQIAAKGRALPEGPRHQRPRHPHHDAGGSDAILAGPHPQGPGHDLRHRQRAARLPHRPVPHPRTRHQRQDAVHRAADGWRRTVRDRVLAARRRSTCSSSRKKAICAGIRSASSSRWAYRSNTWPRCTSNAKAQVLAETLDQANGKILENNQSPARKVGEIDNRGSHFYLAMYWAQALAAQTKDADLQARFAPLAKTLTENEAKITAELIEAQGKPQDTGGYYRPDFEKTSKAMRPSETLNAALAALA